MDPYDYSDRILIGETLGKSLYLRLCCLFEHLWLRGKSRAGKTVWLTSIIYQLIRIAACKKHLSIIQFDPKGDLASLNSAIETCKKYGLPFKFISLTPGQATHVFPPLQQPVYKNMTSVAKAEYLTSGFGLRVSSTEYGKSFFGAKSEGKIGSAVETSVQDFVELAKKIKLVSPSKKGEPDHAELVIDKAAKIPVFNPKTPENFLHMVNVNSIFLKPQYVYVFCNVLENPDTAYPLFRMFLDSLIPAAQSYDEDIRNNVVVIVDEAAHLTSPSLSAFLDMAAGFRCGVVLAHQHAAQLATGSEDYYGSFFGGTNIHIDWSPMLHLDEYQKSGPTTKGKNQTYSNSTGESENTNPEGDISHSTNSSESHGWSEYDKPFFEYDLIREITRNKQQCIIDTLHATEEGWGGFPMIMDTFFHIEKEEHDRRNKTPIRDYIWDKGQIINPFPNEMPEAPCKPPKHHDSNGIYAPKPNSRTPNKNRDELPRKESASLSTTWQMWSEKAKEVHQRVYPTK